VHVQGKYAKKSPNKLPYLHNFMYGLFAGDDQSLILKKVEPWNSVRVTFNIPADAAERLRQLAEHQHSVLHDLGVLAVQIGGDNVMSMSGNGSDSGTKPADAIDAHSCSQSVSQPTLSVRIGGTTSIVQQVKVPTSIVPSCCPDIVASASGALRHTAVEHPVHDVASSSASVLQKPVGLVQWPNLVCGHAGSDAVAVRFAIPSMPVKEFSQGLCLISPLRAGVSPNVATSSPVLVNLLQMRRQQSVAAVPRQPVKAADTSAAVILPQKRRRNSSARKAKQSRNDMEPGELAAGIQLANDGTSKAWILPVSTTLASESNMTTSSVCYSKLKSDAISGKNVTLEPNRARQMINPYTGDLELVDIAEDIVSVDSSTESTTAKSSELLKSGHFVAVSGPSGPVLPSLVSQGAAAFQSGANGKLLATDENGSQAENPTVSLSPVSCSAVPTSLQYVDWYTASQSDKQRSVQCNVAQFGLSSVRQIKREEPISSSSITIPNENLASDNSSTRTEAYSSDGKCLLSVTPLCVNDHSAITSLPRTTATRSCSELLKQKGTSDGVPAQNGNLITSCSTVPQLNTSQNDLIQMAFTLAKQNGSAIHESNLVSDWAKNAGLLQNSLQSLHGLHSVALATAGVALQSSSADSSCASSRLKDIDGCTTTTSTTVASSGACFFPAVSCFPPEHRRKSSANIGALGIATDTHSQTGTSAVVSPLLPTLPAVRIMTSSSTPLDVKSCVSCAPNRSSVITVKTSVSGDSVRPPAPSTDAKKSIPLLTNIAATSWPLMPNLLTVPLVDPKPLSGSQLLHCVTRAPLTPDGKLAGLNAAVANTRSTIVPIAGRFCIPLSASQTISITAGMEKQNVESSVATGIRPHTLLLADNLSKFKLSVSSNASKSSGKHGSSKDRRGNTSRTDDTPAQRGSTKSHLTVAQLLDMAKNARLQQTACDDEQLKSSEQQNELVGLSVQSQSLLTTSPPQVQLSSRPLQSNSALLTSHDHTHATPQLVSVRLSTADSSTCPLSSDDPMQTSSVRPLLSLSSASVSRPTMTIMASALSSHLLSQPPLNAITSCCSISVPSTAASPVIPGEVSLESTHGNEYLALNNFSSSVSASLPVSSYSMHPPLPITSPRYPLNLTESVKKAMRGVGLYPSPPVSPTTTLPAFGSSKLPEIRPYPVSITSSFPGSGLSSTKVLPDRSPVNLPVTSQHLPTLSRAASASCINSFSVLQATAIPTSQEVLKAVSCGTSTTVCAEALVKGETVKNGDIVLRLGNSDVQLVSSNATKIATDCIETRAFPAAQSGTVHPQVTTTEICPNVSATDLAVSLLNSEQFSSELFGNSSVREQTISSNNGLEDNLHNKYDVNIVNGINGGLSSVDLDMELHPDILEDASSVETDARLSSLLRSSPSSAELTSFLDSTRETEVRNCVKPVHERRICNSSVLLNCRLLHDTDSCEYTLQCDTTYDDDCAMATAALTDMQANHDVTSASDCLHSAVGVLCQKAAADSSVMSKYAVLRKNRLEADASSSTSVVRSTARHKRSGVSTTSDETRLQSAAGEQRTVTSAVCVTRMATRSSHRSSVSTTNVVTHTLGTDPINTSVQKTPVKCETRGRELPNYASDVETLKCVMVAQRRSVRTPGMKVVDKKSEAVTTCPDADSGIILRSRRHSQKMNSVSVVTPRKRASLRAVGTGREDLRLVDSTKNVIDVLHGSFGTEIDAIDHEDSR